MKFVGSCCLIVVHVVAVSASSCNFVLLILFHFPPWQQQYLTLPKKSSLFGVSLSSSADFSIKLVGASASEDVATFFFYRP